MRSGAGVNGRKKSAVFFWKTTGIFVFICFTVFPKTADFISAIHTCTIVAMFEIWCTLFSNKLSLHDMSYA